MELGGGLELGRAEPRCSESSRAMELQATEEKPGAKMPPRGALWAAPLSAPGRRSIKNTSGEQSCAFGSRISWKGCLGSTRNLLAWNSWNCLNRSLL